MMTITREQVADLQPGDVVEVAHEDWPEGTVVRGPLWLMDGETLQVARIVVRHWDGRHPFDTGLSLNVISRAPRPLYVNHSRTEPVPGDVVRIEFDKPYDDDSCVNVYLPDPERPHLLPWLSIRHDEGIRYSSEQVLPGPTTKGRAVLLVDGETGQVVP